MKRNNQEQLNGQLNGQKRVRVDSPDNNPGNSNVTTSKLQNNSVLQSQFQSSQSQSSQSVNDTNTSQNAPSTSYDENQGDTISNAVQRECDRYLERVQSGDRERANLSRFLLRSWRDRLLVKLSRAEDRFSDDDPRTEHLRGQLIKSDGHLRAAGLDAVIEDSDYPAAMDFSLLPGSEGGDDLGGDC